MKLRNLLYATMIACVFASCSKDENSMTPEVPEAGSSEGGAITLSIGRAQVRSLGTDDKDATKTLKNVTVVVTTSKGDKKNYVAAIVDNKIEALLTISDLSGGDHVSIQAFANDANVTEGSVSLVNEDVTNGYSMASNIASDVIVPQKGGSTKVGLVLVRNVARIVLNTVKLGTPTVGDDTRSFKIESVFVLNAVNNTMLNGGVASPLSYFAGMVEMPDGSQFVNPLPDATTKKVSYYDVINATKTLSETNQFYSFNKTSSGTENFDTFPYYFVYQNHGSGIVPTLLVVKGTYTTSFGTETTSYYPVKVGMDGVRGDNPKDGIYRNTQYTIDLTITGPGSVDPTDPSSPNVTVKITVKDMDSVDQDVTLD